MGSKPQVIVVGTRHRLQTGHSDYSPAQHAEFARLLETLIEKHGIQYVAEEMTEDILPAYGASESVACRIARERGVNHDYVDLSDAQRAELKIDRWSIHDIAQTAGLGQTQLATLEQLMGEVREHIWVMRVLQKNDWPTLLVCGATHSVRMQLLFNSVGISVDLEANDYAP